METVVSPLHLVIFTIFGYSEALAGSYMFLTNNKRGNEILVNVVCLTEDVEVAKKEKEEIRSGVGKVQPYKARKSFGLAYQGMRNELSV